MQEFHIRRHSTNPVLRMEVFMDGRYDFKKDIMNDAIQNSDVTFTMKNNETGVIKILNAKANIVLEVKDGCEERYILEYKWKPRDTEIVGVYDAFFHIIFKGTLTSGDGIDYPEGDLIVPIQEKLSVIIS